jgi:hypothetical protein
VPGGGERLTRGVLAETASRWRRGSTGRAAVRGSLGPDTRCPAIQPRPERQWTPMARKALRGLDGLHASFASFNMPRDAWRRWASRKPGLAPEPTAAPPEKPAKLAHFSAPSLRNNAIPPATRAPRRGPTAGTPTVRVPRGLLATGARDRASRAPIPAARRAASSHGLRRAPVRAAAARGRRPPARALPAPDHRWCVAVVLGVVATLFSFFRLLPCPRRNLGGRSERTAPVAAAAA